jgi:hypothetical protein
MSSLKRDLRKKRFLNTMRLADEEQLCGLVWAVSEVQARGSTAPLSSYVIPKEARNKGVQSEYYCFPWRLETLVNETFTTEQARIIGGRIIHNLDYIRFNTLTTLLNQLNEWENEESALITTQENVIHHLGRIGRHQFPWQRGWLNLPDFYRTAVLYGGPLATDHLALSGLTLNALSAIGLGLYGTFGQTRYIPVNFDLTEVDVTCEQAKAVLARIACSISDARSEAKSLRAGRTDPAYSPSFLRKFPCLFSENARNSIFSPLPELLLYRVTTGLYYDVIGGGSAVANEIGANFENYSLNLLGAMMPDMKVSGEVTYRRRGNTVKSPDILASKDDEVSLVIECKATKMNVVTRFGFEPLTTGHRGFDDLVKAVAQIWRFVADVRLGRVDQITLSEDAKGLVLTLDPWMDMTVGFGARVISAANQLIASDLDILEVDKRQIAFGSIEDFEDLLAMAKSDEFLATIAVSSKPDNGGWTLGNLFKQEFPQTTRDRKRYPFLEQMNEKLPWRRLIEAAAARSSR